MAGGAGTAVGTSVWGACGEVVAGSASVDVQGEAAADDCREGSSHLRSQSCLCTLPIGGERLTMAGGRGVNPFLCLMFFPLPLLLHWDVFQSFGVPVI